jgi:two-component system response regulator PilR (NtrC family)
MSMQTTSILLVEDDLSLQTSLRGFFEDHGFQTHTAGTLQEGREQLLIANPDICLLDMNLPDGSGLDLLRVIVQERLPVRVIVMSAFPIEHLRQRFPKSVVVASITKPVSPQQLLDIVDRIGRDGAEA